MNPLIVTLQLDAESFSVLDGLRKKYFPPAKNFIPAHISLFHALPNERAEFVERELESLAKITAAFEIFFAAPRRLSGGFAVSAQSPALDKLHASLRNSFAPWLSRQDQQPFRPHVTLMNKADKSDAEKAWVSFQPEWQNRRGTGTGLLLWEYLGGPWRLVRNYPFL